MSFSFHSFNSGYLQLCVRDMGTGIYIITHYLGYPKVKKYIVNRERGFDTMQEAKDYAIQVYVERKLS